MKKIIPFKKQVYFKTNVEEITSISLEHTLTPNSANSIKGEFVISGDYKMTNTSVSTDPFEFNIPCDIELNENSIEWNEEYFAKIANQLRRNFSKECCYGI